MMRCFYVGFRSFNSNPSSKSAHFLSSVTIFTNIINTTCRCCHSLSFGASYNNEIKVDSLHAKATKNGSIQHLDVNNHVLNLYTRKYQNLDDAHKLFDEMLNKDVRSWTVMISGFSRNGCHQKGLDYFKRMQIEGACANQFTLSSVFKCCSSLLELRNGKAIHGWILLNGIGLDLALGNSILDHYVKCGAFDYAERLFKSMEVKDLWSCNVMLGGYLHNGDVEKSLALFESLHCKDVASWNTIINGLIRNGSERIALKLLYKMVENGPMFNAITFSTALHLVSCLTDLELGKQIHGRVLRLGIHYNVFIRNSLLDMYCKCGKMENASMIFRKMLVDVSLDDQTAEIVSWSSMVAGCVQNGEYENALKTFCFMVRENIEVDKFTLTSIVSACTSIGVLVQGRQIHAYIKKIGHKVDAHMGSSLIDMYAKCGSFSDARKIFKQTTDLNVVLWTSMISGCALHGQGRDAVRLFERMMNEKIIPNEITFICLLTACSHAGLLEEGCKYFKLMQTVCGIKPGVEHYTCMVDLYGRAGRLKQIKEFIHENGISHLSAVWKSFLSSCRLHKNVEMGKWVSQRLVQLEPFDPGPYVLLSNMLAADYSWEEAADVRNLMHQKNVNKLPGQSWIQLKNQVHTFVMDDRSHPQVTEIYSYLEKLIGRLKEIGYLPDLKPVTQDVEDEEGEILLGFHSEKLATTYGIISTTSGTPICIMKNLRVCSDCHNFMKFTSQLLSREIIVRDIRRFHHFKQGHCSCGDYW